MRSTGRYVFLIFIIFSGCREILGYKIKARKRKSFSEGLAARCSCCRKGVSMGKRDLEINFASLAFDIFNIFKNIILYEFGKDIIFQRIFPFEGH